MRTAWSLRTRTFVACTILATLSLGFAFAYVNARATGEAETDLQRGLAATLSQGLLLSELLRRCAEEAS